MMGLCLRSNHKPLFVRMTPMQSDWSPMGLKGIIPSLLHHSLLGYNFLIPDAVGNTTASGSLFSSLIVHYSQSRKYMRAKGKTALEKYHFTPDIAMRGATNAPIISSNNYDNLMNSSKTTNDSRLLPNSRIIAIIMTIANIL